MSSTDREISHQLTQAVCHLIPTIFGDGYELSSVPPLRVDRRYSFMFRFWLKHPNGDMSSMLVKIPHESWMASIYEATESSHIRHVITNEFDRLTSIADVIAESGSQELFAIRPKALLYEFNALMVEEISIRMLKTSLLKPAVMLGMGNEWRVFETQLMLAGKWLKVIHDRFRSEQGETLKSLKIKEKVVSDLEALEKILSRSLNKIHDEFIGLFELLHAVEIPLANLHRDFQLGNIFVTRDGRIGALDPNWGEAGAIYDDLSTLIVDPISRKMQVLTQGFSFRPSLQKRYEQAISQGYFGVSHRADPILDFYCAFAVLKKWRANEEILCSSDSKAFIAGSFLIRFLMRGYFKKLIHGYLARGMKFALV